MENRQETSMLQIKIGGQTKTYPAGITYQEIVKEFQKDFAHAIVLVKADGRLQELHRKPMRDCGVEPVTVAQPEGFRAYRRSMTLLMLKAMYHVAGHENVEKIGIHFTIGNGLYCTFKGKQKLTETFLEEVKAYMREISNQNLPIIKRSVETGEAISLFREYGMKDKEKLFHYRRVSNVNLYSLGGFEDYYYGYMVPETGVLKWFDLKLYDEGFLLLMPNRSNPEVLPDWRPREKIFYVQKESLKWGEMLDVATVGDMNEYIVHKDASELVLTAEALQEKKIAEMAAKIAANPDKKLIMIAGPSSSGKTTFSHRLSIQLAAHGLKPHPIPVDDYFVNREDTPKDEDGNLNFECLEAIDIAQFNEDMNRLLAGEKVELPTFNFETGRREYRGKFRQLGKEDILVIEGIHCLNDKLSYSLPKESKMKIYISALTQLNVDEHNRIPTTDGRLLRRLVRDARTRGASAKKTIAMWPSVRRGEESYIFPYQEEADIMFNSALIYEISVLKMYAEPLLYSIREDEPEYQEAKRLLKFMDYFLGIPDDSIPNNSLLREFIGGGCFRL